MLTVSQRQPAILITCGLLLLSLFLTWMGMQNSAFGLIFNPPPDYANPGLLCRLALLLIGGCAGLILYYRLKKNGAYPVPEKLLFTLPLVLTVIAFLAIRAKVGPFMRGWMTMADVLGTGFWLCLLAAVFLCVLGWTAAKPAPADRQP